MARQSNRSVFGGMRFGESSTQVQLKQEAHYAEAGSHHSAQLRAYAAQAREAGLQVRFFLHVLLKEKNTPIFGKRETGMRPH